MNQAQFDFNKERVRESYDRRVIKHAYENVLDRCARLDAFSTSRPVRLNGFVCQRQIQLAIDDLIVFALHARRLIDHTNLISRAKNSNIYLCKINDYGSRLTFPRTEKSISIWRILGLIVHFEDIRIFRTGIEIRVRAGVTISLSDIILRDKDEIYNPIVYVYSDQVKPIIFELSELIDKFSSDVLDPVYDICGENDIDVDQHESGFD